MAANAASPNGAAFNSVRRDDATLVLKNGLVVACFAREAEGFGHAVVSAYSDIAKTGGIIERFEPDFLVSQTEIAARTKLSRAAISLYVSGERGSGFPPPHARITSSSPLWDWVEVSSWMHKHAQLSLEEVVNARLSRAINWFVQNPLKAMKATDRDLWEIFEGAAREPFL
ncbi:hypothetical protein WH91_01735 [Devosia psychrophila]|uniref:Transcriptional regulator, AlpA family n=2 Tax=Devosia psychrophila TaxID=728005 RepID=A0ABR5E2X7_9HYPH|nr:hypothetical protein WH91_01735 [Devosia psychrophila]